MSVKVNRSRRAYGIGDVLYRAAERQMNWKKAGKPFNPYTGNQ